MNVRSNYIRILIIISTFLGSDHTGHCLCDKCSGQAPSLTGKMLFSKQTTVSICSFTVSKVELVGKVLLWLVVNLPAVFSNSLQSFAYDNVHVISKTVCYKYHEIVLLLSLSERHE